MVSETIVKKQIEWLKSKYPIYCELLQKRVRIEYFSYFAGAKRIAITVSYNYPHTEMKTWEFDGSEWNDYISKFYPLNSDEKVKLIIEKEVYKTQVTPFNLKHYKFTLDMSDTTKNNFDTLRDSLFSAIAKLERKEITPADAQAINQTAQVIINSVKLELDYKKLISKNPKVIMLETKTEQ